jgi:beta-lactamase superfamily II metal-dependent hydrolase
MSREYAEVAPGAVRRRRVVRSRVLGCIRIAALSLIGILVLGCTLASSPPAVEPKLIVYFLDVEQGNCILIVSPSGTAALIDAGTGQGGNGDSDTNPAEFIRALEAATVGFRLRYVVLTHYDADHIGKLDDVLQAVPSLVTDDYRLFTRQGGWVKTSAPSDAYQFIGSIGVDHRVAIAPSDVIDLGGGVTLTCYAAGGSYWDGTGIQTVALLPTDENGRSVALILTYRDVKMWFGGDLGHEVEQALAEHLPDIDVYAVDHHGSSGSSDPSFLRALKPEYAICQSGETNSYGHPNEVAVGRILSIVTTDGVSHPQFIQQNHGKPADLRSDDGLATAIADPDGSGPLPGTITVTTDGFNPTVTWPGKSAGASSIADMPTLPADAAAEAGVAVCINEIEQNPLGSDTGNEWVELYNPTDSVVDLSSWEIRATHGASASVRIAPGTLISGHGFCVVGNAVQWLDNASEVVELRDASGRLVDVTPLGGVSDSANDARAWGRMPDGAPDWVFLPSSRGARNG